MARELRLCHLIAIKHRIGHLLRSCNASGLQTIDTFWQTPPLPAWQTPSPNIFYPQPIIGSEHPFVQVSLRLHVTVNFKQNQKTKTACCWHYGLGFGDCGIIRKQNKVVCRF